MSPPLFPRIEAAAIDGRQHNLYHRHVQLERLHDALLSNTESIKSAITSDSLNTPLEVTVEFAATLNALKHQYSLLDAKRFHEQEYLVANGKDHAANRTPVGVVYVEPNAGHTLFYSAVVAVGAALAAGNCVALLLESHLRSPAVSKILRHTLTEALDSDVFTVATKKVTEEKFLSKLFCVLQNGENDHSHPRSNELTSPNDRPVVAVVDRTADLDLAAKELVATRTAFGGRSPYAPDVVLINEFSQSAFLSAVSKEYAQVARARSDANPKTSTRITAGVAMLRKSDPNCQVLQQESDFAVVQFATRTNVLRQKTDTSIMAIYPIKSLDDAVDLINSRSSNPCSAAYHFGKPTTAKYLSQFIPAEVSFVNHVPREILLGPAAPLGRELDIADRYSIDMFTVQRPVLVNPSATSSILVKALGKSKTIQAMAEWAAPLKEFKRHPGGGIGFFEKGFLINAGLILGTTLTVSASGVIWWWTRSRAIGL